MEKYEGTYYVIQTQIGENKTKIKRVHMANSDIFLTFWRIS